MSSDWQRVEIGQLAKLRSGFPFKSSDWKDSGVPVIKIANVKGGRIIPDGCGFVSTDVASKSAEWYTRTGDVLIAMTGYVGEVAQVKPGEMYLINQRVGRFDFLPNSEVESTYFFYHLQHPETRAEIEGVARGSAQPNLSAGDAHKIKITLPPLAVQREIAATLSVLDGRINLLREINTTLEAIAQALFKSWFVDFDPVHAKMEGRTPEGMDEATAALFPDGFETSELGEVPRGWRWGTLSDLATFQNGYAFKSKDWTDSGHPVVKIGDVKPGIIDLEGCSYVAHETVVGLDRFRLSRGDLLVGMTGYVGATGLVPSVEPAAYLNQRVGRMATKSGVTDLGYLYCAARSPAFKEFAEAQSHGSAQANVSGASLMAFPAVIAPLPLMERFNGAIADVLEVVLTNHEQAQTLSTLRDTLLPHLISGQLRLPETENLIKALIF